MKIYVDIDDVICKQPDGTKDLNYHDRVPIKENIEKFNELYSKGHSIVYWTARGTETGIDWSVVTTKQLIKWNCRFDKLVLGKPAFDVFIDDKAFNVDRINELFNSINQQIHEESEIQSN